MTSKKIKMYIYVIGIAATIFIGKNAYAAGITDGQVVSANKAWKISFSHSINLDDLNKQGIVVQDSKGNNVSVSIISGNDGKSILINPPKGGYKSGLIDSNGKVAIESQFKEVGDFNNGLAAVKADNGKYGFIDKTGKVVIQPQFDAYTEGGGGEGFQFQYNFNGNYAVVVKDGQFGVIDKSGNYKIKPDSNFKIFVSDKLILVGQGENGYKYIDVDGNTIFSNSDMPVSSAMEAQDLFFQNGLASVVYNNKQAYIDKTGKVVWQE